MMHVTCVSVHATSYLPPGSTISWQCPGAQLGRPPAHSNVDEVYQKLMVVVPNFSATPATTCSHLVFACITSRNRNLRAYLLSIEGGYCRVT